MSHVGGQADIVPREILAPGPLWSRGWETTTMTQQLLEPMHTSKPAGPGTRLSIKAESTKSGHVDGAWWPGSRDLAAEVPALVEQLSARWGPVDRVSYDLAAWLPAARSVPVGGRRIRLDGFRGRRPTDAVHVLKAGRPALTLLVVLPATDSGEAAETLRRAGSAGNRETVDELLRPGPRSPGPAPARTSAGSLAGTGVRSRTDDDAGDLGRWDADGGHGRRRTG